MSIFHTLPGPYPCPVTVGSSQAGLLVRSGMSVPADGVDVRPARGTRAGDRGYGQ
jgi:hypothetical protein